LRRPTWRANKVRPYNAAIGATHPLTQRIHTQHIVVSSVENYCILYVIGVLSRFWVKIRPAIRCHTDIISIIYGRRESKKKDFLFRPPAFYYIYEQGVRADYGRK
jgi:hypothetical protein